MKPVIGVVGTGHIAQFHLAAYQRLGVRVAVIADVSRETAQPYADKFGAEFTSSWEELVGRPEINTVAIFTPSALHYPVVKAALEAGKNVVCEKTLTTSPEQSLELGRLAGEKRVQLYTSYMKRFFPALRRAKELMSGLGHITSAYCRTYQGVGSDIHTGDAAGWAPDGTGTSAVFRKTGGGILVCGGSHIFDLLLFLLGKPSTVYGRSFQRPGFDLDFMHHALFDLPDGGVIHFEGNWHGLRHIGFEGRGWDEGFEISGVNGRLVIETPTWDLPTNNAARLRHYENSTGHWTEYVFDVVSPFEEAEKYFLAQIEAGAQGEPDAFSGYRVDYLLEMAARSARENRPLALEWEA